MWNMWILITISCIKLSYLVSVLFLLECPLGVFPFQDFKHGMRYCVSFSVSLKSYKGFNSPFFFAPIFSLSPGLQFLLS